MQSENMLVCLCVCVSVLMDAHLTLHLGLLFQAAVLRSVCHGGEVCLGVVSEEHNHNTESTVTQSTHTHVHARTHARTPHPPTRIPRQACTMHCPTPGL